MLALISVSAKRTWAKIANTHLVLLLLATFLIFAYRDLWPLVTYTLQPADAYEDGLLWAKCVVLVLTAVVIPLVIPRQYVPFDPKACYRHHLSQMKNLTRGYVQEPAPEPNPEQTTSLLSLAFYNFLDPVIFKAYRTPHLPVSELPPLADYDHGKNLVKRSFKVN